MKSYALFVLSSLSFKASVVTRIPSIIVIKVIRIAELQTLNILRMQNTVMFIIIAKVQSMMIVPSSHFQVKWSVVPLTVLLEVMSNLS